MAFPVLLLALATGSGDRLHPQVATKKSLWDMGLQIFRAHLSRRQEIVRKSVQGLLALIEAERSGDQVLSTGAPTQSFVGMRCFALFRTACHFVVHTWHVIRAATHANALCVVYLIVACPLSPHFHVYPHPVQLDFQVERMLLHSLLRMFHDLGMYVELFELPFLRTTREFYAAEAAAHLQAMDVPTFLQHVQTRLTQEEQRVQHYLHMSTRKALLQTALQTLLATAHVDTLLEKGFTSLMEQSRHEDLRSMYTLLALVDALPRLRQVCVAAHHQSVHQSIFRCAVHFDRVLLSFRRLPLTSSAWARLWWATQSVSGPSFRICCNLRRSSTAFFPIHSLPMSSSATRSKKLSSRSSTSGRCARARLSAPHTQARICGTQSSLIHSHVPLFFAEPLS